MLAVLEIVLAVVKSVAETTEVNTLAAVIYCSNYLAVKKQ